MNFKTTVLLLGLLVIVGAYFVFVEVFLSSTTTTTDTRRHRDRQRLLGEHELTFGRLVELTMTRGEQSVTLQREHNAWFQTQPVRFGIDSNQVERIVQSALDLRITPVADVPPLAEVGLEPAALTLRLAVLPDDDGEPATTEPGAASQPSAAQSLVLRIGQPLRDGRFYVLLDDDPLPYLVSGTLHTRLARSDIHDWRTRRLADMGVPTADQAVGLDMSDAQHSVSLRKHIGRWQLKDQPDARIDVDAIEEVLAAIRRIQIQRFITDDPARLSMLGLDPPQRRIDIHAPPGRARLAADAATQMRTLRLGLPVSAGETAAVYATWSDDAQASPVVFTIPYLEARQLGIHPDSLRDRSISLLAQREVGQIHIQRNGRTHLHMLRREGNWLLQAPQPTFPLQFDRVNQLVQVLMETRGIGFVDQPVPDDLEPHLTITLKHMVTDATDHLRFYSAQAVRVAGVSLPELEPSEDLLVVYRADEAMGRIVRAQRLEMLLQPVVLLRDRRVARVDVDSIARVILDRPGEPTYTFEAKPGVEGSEPGLRMVGQELFETASLARAVAALDTITAQAWLGDTQPVTESWVRLTVERADGHPPMLLRFDPQTRRAMLDEGPDQFTLDAQTAQAWQQEFRYRSAVPITVQDIDQVRIEQGNDVFVVRIRDRQARADDARPLNHTATVALLDALTPLRVVRYLPEDTALGTPRRTLTVTTHEGQRYVLEVHDADGGLIRIDGRPAALDGRRMERLIANLSG